MLLSFLAVPVVSLANPPETDLEPVVVTAPAPPLTLQNRSAVPFDADPMTLPQSVGTIPAELLDRQDARTLSDAVTNVPGVYDPGTSGSLYIRGFDAGIMRNGTLNATSLSIFSPPVIGISRIEVLKGPEAIIAGQSAGFGGLVNVVTKAPQAQRSAEARLQLGDHGRQSLGLDIGGALTEDKRAMGRLVVAGNTEGKDQLGYDGNRGNYIAPSLGFRDRTTGTEIVFSYERNEQAQKNFWSVYFNPATQKLDQSLKPVRLGDNGQRLGEGTEENLALYLNQQLTDSWRLSLKAVRQDLEQKFSGGTVGLVIAYPRVVGLEVDGSTTASKNEFRIDLNGEFDTGPIDHKLLLAYVNDRSSLRQQQATPFKRDLFNAVDGRLIAPLGNAGPQRVVVDQAPRETGVLIMDQLSWEKWVVVAGVRQVSYAPGEKLSATSDNYNATLPSLGVVYRLTPSQSLYTSLAKSFMANAGKTEFATRQQVEPEEAQQVELGFKQLFRERQLALTAALYRIEQKNYAALDTVHSTFPVNYYVTVPGITSRGLDVELSGRLTDHLDIRAAYNYSDIDAPTDVPSIPFAHQQYKLSLIYSLTGDKQGAWFGGGMQGRDAAQTRDYPGSPREFRMDVYGGYDARNWSLQAGVKNLTDRQNYTLESGANGVGIVIQPREIYLAAHLRF